MFTLLHLTLQLNPCRVYNGNCIGFHKTCNGPSGLLMVIEEIKMEYVPKHKKHSNVLVLINI